MRARSIPLAFFLGGVCCLVVAAAPYRHTLSTTPDWSAAEIQSGSGFGRHVSNAGDVNNDGYDDVLVTAPGWSGGEAAEGRASLFLGSASGLSLSSPWSFESDFQLASLEGAAAAGDVNGDGFADVLLCAPKNGLFTPSGFAWLFLGSSAGLSSTPAWIAGGSHVSGAGDVNGDGFDDVIVGFPGASVHRDDGEGVAYLYRGSSNTNTRRYQVFKGEQPFSGFGVVAGAGDINGDGLDDVLIGSPEYLGAQGTGRVYVHKGSNSGLKPSAVAVLEIAGESRFGTELGPAGDINADGLADFFVLARGPGAQIVYLYLGSSDFRALQPLLMLQSDPPSFDLTFASAGDVNDDGFSDVIMGVPAQDRAFVYRGTAAGLDPVPLQVLDGQAGEFFGTSVSTGGDVNGDGFDDVIVGAPSYAPGGRTLAYHGGL